MSLIEEIIERGNIKKLTSSKGSGTTGEAHLAKIGSKKYVLRICNSKETADWYQLLYKKMKKFDFLPRLLESKSHYLLLEYIEGRDLKENEDKKIIREVGKICAEVNKIRYKGNYQNYFLEKVDDILSSKIISKEKAEEIKKLYTSLMKKTKIKLGLDIGDSTNDNFRLSKRGKLYFVDIEAVKYHLKGMSITKAFYNWFKSLEEQDAFSRGYSSVHSMRYFTNDYQKLCLIIFLIQRIRYKHNKVEKAALKKSLKKLDNLLTPNKKP